MIQTAMSQNEEQLPGPTGLSLRSNFAWSFTGNVIYMASQWAMLAVLAKLGSPETVGQFALGLAVTAPIILFTNLQLRAVIATDARNENTFSDYFTLRIATTIFSIFIILGLVFISDYSRQTALVILVIGIAKVFESLSDIVYGLLQQNEQMARIAWSMMIRGPLSLLIMAVCMFIWGNILIAVIGLAFVWLMVFLFYDMHSVPWLQKRIHEPINLQISWDGTTQRRLIRLAFPLGLTAMLASLNTNIPRYLLENYFGEGMLGLFTAMAYLLVAGNAVVGALGQSASPRLAKYFAARSQSLPKLLSKAACDSTRSRYRWYFARILCRKRTADFAL